MEAETAIRLGVKLQFGDMTQHNWFPLGPMALFLTKLTVSFWGYYLIIFILALFNM